MAQNPWDEDEIVGQQNIPQGPVVPPLPPSPQERRQEQRQDIQTSIAQQGSVRDGIRTGIAQQKNVRDAQQVGRDIRQNPISKEDGAFINKLREQAQIAQNAIRELQSAAVAGDRFDTGPSNARNTTRSIVQEDDGLLTQGARGVYGLLSGVSKQDQQDYQELDRLRQARVARIQQEQKGPQTESDAARYMKSTFGPDKMPDVNARSIAEATYAARMDVLRPEIYLQWANKYGSLNALNEKGQGIDEVWSEAVRKGWEKNFLEGTPSGRRLYGDKKKKTGGSLLAPQQRVIDFGDY